MFQSKVDDLSPVRDRRLLFKLNLGDGNAVSNKMAGRGQDKVIPGSYDHIQRDTSQMLENLRGKFSDLL